MKEIVIIGAGDFGRETVWLIEEINRKQPAYTILGYLDDAASKHGQIMNGYEVLGGIDYLSELSKTRRVYAVIAMQEGAVRKKIVERTAGFENWETVIHPSVNIAASSRIGKGCIICAGSNISVDTQIGNFCIFNISSTVGHDCKVADYASAMSGTVICGHVCLGEGVYLGSNASILPGRVVGENAKVGAGSVVLRNVRAKRTVMGVPAKAVHF